MTRNLRKRVRNISKAAGGEAMSLELAEEAGGDGAICQMMAAWGSLSGEGDG